MFGSIEKAGSFLLANQKRDGSLHESLYFHGSHFVSAKAALPLVKLYKITNEKKYLDSAYRLANHVISSFNKSGGGFSLDLDVPHYNRTHFLCYAVEGLTALNEYYPEFSDYIVNACRYLAELQDSRGFIPYGFSPNGALSINSPDLAATAQTARLMLYAQNNISPEEGKYQRIVEKCVSFLLEKQHKFRHSFLDGGVPYGYKLFMDRVTVCSWATLFLANALLMVLFPDFRRISF